jgi:hypothetical protein
LFAIALGTFILVIIAAFAYSHATGNKLRTAEWEELVAALEPVHSRGLEIVALENLQPHGNQLRLEPDEMWALVGGMEGLKRMQRNADLMIALAAYVHRWNYDQSVIVAERIRHDSILLKRALFRIQWNLYVRRSQLRVPFYIHQAASAYYLMTKRLLTLYETNQYMLYPKLSDAL